MSRAHARFSPPPLLVAAMAGVVVTLTARLRLIPTIGPSWLAPLIVGIAVFALTRRAPSPFATACAFLQSTGRYQLLNTSTWSMGAVAALRSTDLWVRVEVDRDWLDFRFESSATLHVPASTAEVRLLLGERQASPAPVLPALQHSAAQVTFLQSALPQIEELFERSRLDSTLRELEALRTASRAANASVLRAARTSNRRTAP